MNIVSEYYKLIFYTAFNLVFIKEQNCLQNILKFQNQFETAVDLIIPSIGGYSIFAMHLNDRNRKNDQYFRKKKYCTISKKTNQIFISHSLSKIERIFRLKSMIQHFLLTRLFSTGNELKIYEHHLVTIVGKIKFGKTNNYISRERKRKREKRTGREREIIIVRKYYLILVKYSCDTCLCCFLF